MTRSTRGQAAADNAEAEARRNPARLIFGPNACASGHVRRDVDESDYVCVHGDTRAQVQADNAAVGVRPGASRRQLLGL